MIDQALAVVKKQVRRVQRRLFVQVVLQSLFLGWALALLVATFWFLLRPFTFAGLGETVRWVVPGSLLAVGTVGGLVFAWARRPDLVVSSLALDEKFNLHERVTTLLTLPPAQFDTPIGQALLRDVHEHLSALEVASRFPIRLSPQHLLMPFGALVLALLGCVLDPVLSDLKFGSRTQAVEPKKTIDTTEIQQELDKLKKAVEERNQQQQTKSEKLQELEKEFKDLVKSLDTKDEEKVREQLTKMLDLKDKMNQRMDGLQEKRDKADQLKKFLEKLGLDKNEQLKEGAAKDFEEALTKGDFNKAKDVLEKLAKDLKNDKLSKEKQKEVADQLKQLQDKMKKLLDNDDLMKQLKQDAKDGKISKEELQREMERFKDLQDLTDILGDCQECLGKLEGKDAAGKLEKLMEHFKQVELTEEEIRDLLRDQNEVDDAARLLLAQMRAMQGDGEGGGPPGGKRSIDPNDPNSKIINQRQKADADLKGLQRVSGYGKGGNFNKIPAKSFDEAFRKAAQDAPEALDHQRIPADGRDITQGYFDNLVNQKSRK